jgi:brefeldin A-resistance guanine nucleotide exchange factor 1
MLIVLCCLRRRADNPNMKEEKRMTLDQFIRNNRGINGGADLPIEFLTNLYCEIKVSSLGVIVDIHL